MTLIKWLSYKIHRVLQNRRFKKRLAEMRKRDPFIYK